jgi:branched-subunit amino acid aminotransferase/4-amino-4-deoxychorismate lyase
MAFREAAEKGAQEAIWFTPDNRLAEACFRNVFLVLDGKVLTPPLDTPVLPGVVREAVLELCAKLDIPADDKTALTVKEMLAAREVFLTGSGVGVCPVVRIERHAVGDEKPGPTARKLQSAYEELVEGECRTTGERLEVRG